MDPDTKRHLLRASTATLTTQLFKRGLCNVFMQGVRRLGPPGPNIVGPAMMLRCIPVREDLNHLGMFADPEHPQRKAVETAYAAWRARQS